MGNFFIVLISWKFYFIEQFCISLVQPHLERNERKMTSARKPTLYLQGSQVKNLPTWEG